MKIYFSGAISAGRDNQPIYQYIVQRLQSQGHNVLSAHIADPQVLDREKDVPPRTVFDRDVAWIDECDVMIAEVSTPSTGVGYEYGYAIQIGRPVLCVYRAGLRLTKMITGNPASNLKVAVYSNEFELDQIVDSFLKSRTRRLTD
jgi:2'-deoxynucleoside 5'-phosphate N-hydrolase